jgi:hypothetical protein
MEHHPTETARVEPATQALRRHQRELDELMRQQGVTDRSELIDSFRRDDGTLDETEDFLRAAAALAVVEHLEEVTER